MDDLTACFPRPAALQAFSSHSSLVRPDVFLRLPPAANFAGEAVAGRPDFVSHTPAAVMAALLTTREATLQQCPSSRDSVETGSVNADLHFALYCTPYYGYTPQSETDFVAMTFTLADFLVYTCFTTDSGRAGERARSHGPTMGYRDIHQESADGQGAVWNSFPSHVPQYESLASAFYCTMDHWVGYTTDAIPRSTIDPILTSYKVLCSKYHARLHAWRLPPHTLAYNLLCSPCTLLILYSSKVLVLGLIMLL